MSSHECRRLWMFISIAVGPAIRSSDEQAFDYNMSEESENNNFIVKKSLWPVPSRCQVEQAKKQGGFRPSSVIQETPQDPRQRGGRRSLDEGYN